MDFEKEIDHEYTDEIICPYCGNEFTDSWEYGINEEDLGLLECDECGKSFYASRHIEITYVTEEANYGTCNHCKAENVVIEDYRSTIGKYSGLCVKCGVKEKARLYTEYADSLQNRKNN
jgi:transcription elongation factor Elf1